MAVTSKLEKAGKAFKEAVPRIQAHHDREKRVNRDGKTTSAE